MRSDFAGEDLKQGRLRGCEIPHLQGDYVVVAVDQDAGRDTRRADHRQQHAVRVAHEPIPWPLPAQELQRGEFSSSELTKTTS